MRTGMAELKDERLAGIVSDAVARLVAAYSPERIYLFGSTARGDAGPDSDVDFLVVLPDDAPDDSRQPRLGYEALRNLDVPKDVVVFTADKFDRQLHLKASFPSAVVRDGVLLYHA